MGFSLEKLRVIAKAKFSDKSNLGDWYQKRLEICAQCPINSEIKKQSAELSLKEKAMVTANIGKPTCLACGCEIAAKASVEGETCGLIKKGLEPLWHPVTQLQGEQTSSGKLKIWNHNPDKAEVLLENSQIILEYGVVPHAFDSEVTLELESQEGPIGEVRVSAGCGCTNTSGQLSGQGKALVTIGYDTVGRKGPVTKTFNVHFKVNGKVRLLTGKLRINVEAPKQRIQ